MKRILLTGCAGFIGSNFVKKIPLMDGVKGNYQFDILDALTYAGRYETIKEQVESNDDMNFYQLDIRDAVEINNLFEKNNYDGVIHFAAESHVDNSIKNPNIFVETNVIGTLNLLNASKKTSESKDFRFVHVSTDEVYGSLTEEDPAFTEEHKIAPNSPYSASKASSDLLVRSFNETFGLDTVITRCSNNYGPYQFPEKLIPLMIGKCNAEEKLPVYGDGRNIRDWIYVDDHNVGVWLAYTKGQSGHVYNLGGDSMKRNIDVVKTIINILDKSEDLIDFVEDRLGHDWRYDMDFSKAKRELGFEPSVAFEQGIRQTVDWYQSNMDWIQMLEDTKA